MREPEFNRNSGLSVSIFELTVGVLAPATGVVQMVYGEDLTPVDLTFTNVSHLFGEARTIYSLILALRSRPVLSRRRVSLRDAGDPNDA